MVRQYKLPSPDGRFVLVETRQAGQTVHDSDGNPLEVPTLLELKRLEFVEEQAPSAAPAWNPKRGAMFVVGAVLALGGCWAMLHYYRMLPQDLQPQHIATIAVGEALLAAATPDYVAMPERQDYQQFSAVQLYQVWKQLIDIDLQGMPPAVAERRAQLRTELTTKIMVGGLVAASGLGLLVVALLVPLGRKS